MLVASTATLVGGSGFGERWVYYLDPGHNQRVGRKVVDCNGAINIVGRVTPYYDVYYGSCPRN